MTYFKHFIASAILATTLNFNNETIDNKHQMEDKVLYFKKIIKPSDKEKNNHSQYLKTNLKKNFFN